LVAEAVRMFCNLAGLLKPTTVELIRRSRSDACRAAVGSSVFHRSHKSAMYPMAFNVASLAVRYP